jgi:hypothetical protein
MHVRNWILPLAALATTGLWADEGIWLFEQFPKDRLARQYRVTLSDAFLQHIQASSVRLNNGGSGSFVSPDGLVLTNHHVASYCIQQLSTASADLIKDGFYARTRAEEKSCPDLEINVLLKAEDVTARIRSAWQPEGKDSATVSRNVRAQMARVEKACAEATGNRCDVVALYSGEVFHLYQYRKYTDVRLVFAPENAVAMFGGDPDNYTYPRYCLDVSFLRAYDNGKPLHVDHFLRWSATGARDGELSLVSGHPANTGRLATMAELEFQRDIAFPFVIDHLRGLIAGLSAYSAESQENKRIAADELFEMQNSFKAYSGFLQGLREPDLMNRKRDEEQTLRAFVQAEKPLFKEYGRTWDGVAAAYAEFARIYRPYMLLEKYPARGSSLFMLARVIVRMNEEVRKPSETRLREFRDTMLPSKRQYAGSPIPIYPSFEIAVLTYYFRSLEKEFGSGDALVQRVLDGREPGAAARWYVESSRLADAAFRKRLMEGGAEWEASHDSMLELVRRLEPEARKVRTQFDDKVEANMYASSSQIARVRFAKYGTEAYPDATFTLRLSYGAVKGYTNAAGKAVPSSTNFAGLFRRATGEEPFALPQRWLAARRRLNLRTQLDFVTTADTHGGNSGSPTINARGQVTGLLFDGNLESLPNRYVYRDRVERSVHVSTAGITEALRAVYQARPLLRELGVISK